MSVGDKRGFEHLSLRGKGFRVDVNCVSLIQGQVLVLSTSRRDRGRGLRSR